MNEWMYYGWCVRCGLEFLDLVLMALVFKTHSQVGYLRPVLARCFHNYSSSNRMITVIAAIGIS